MSITTLKGTAWYINDTFVTETPIDAYINFELEAGTKYIRFKTSSSNFLYYYRSASAYSTAYSYYTGWYLAAYRQIIITGGDDVENSALIAWFQTNAVQYAPVMRVKYGEIRRTADAIRGKSGNSNSITWTDGSGFETAVNAIYLGNDTRQTTAKSSDLKYGKTAYSKEIEIIGTMESASGVSF